MLIFSAKKNLEIEKSSSVLTNLRHLPNGILKWRTVTGMLYTVAEMKEITDRYVG